MDSYRRNRYCSCMRCMSWNLFGAAMIITVGIVGLLNNLRVMYWSQSWPVFLIVVGALKFAQNGAPMDGHIQPAPRMTTPPLNSNPAPAATAQGTNPSSEANHG